MTNLDLIRTLVQKSSSRILLLVLDGLGGMPIRVGGPTELEAADTPNLDRLAAEGTLGQIVPIMRGITPGSGPAHLALLGYDPQKYLVGRGVLEARGVGLSVGEQDVAARANFCTVDLQGNITDRRAGRIAGKDAIQITESLKDIRVPGVEIDVKHVLDYRFVVVMRGERLCSDVSDTDPQRVGVPALSAVARSPNARRTADLFNVWIDAARRVLEDHQTANSLTMRGFSSDPSLPVYSDVYKLRAACVSVYPMYKGVACLAGMDVLSFSGDTVRDEFAALASAWNDYNFFFMHVKDTDSRGEDGDFDGKVHVIERLDDALPDLLELGPDVLIVTGDHSSPARLRSHSWHPVPLLLWAPDTHLTDHGIAFGERECARGGLGTFSSQELMPLALAHAGKLAKYGA